MAELTPSEARLATLEAIRDRSLSDEEQREALYLAMIVRQYERRRQRMADPSYRQAYLGKKAAWYRASREARA